MNSLKSVLIITGEVSGDVHGGYLLKALKKENQKLNMFAVGSTHLQEAGATLLADLTRRSTIGFIETLKHIPALLFLKNKLSRLLSSGAVDTLICIDYQGFNMIMADIAKKKGIRVVYYIPPQEWVWGSSKGMQKVVNLTDQIMHANTHRELISYGSTEPVEDAQVAELITLGDLLVHQAHGVYPDWFL